ncbi:MAG: hypothetical protein GVY20_04835, partial [Bacteroidetes bacterium]|nr:hypothetical protein [Bacteroidota bacterium]
MNNRKFTNLLSLFVSFVALFSVSSMNAQVVTCTTTGETITINTGDDAFAGEVGWELFNVSTGEVVAYEQTGFPLGANQSVTFDVPVGQYELYGYDSFGDNWGGFFGPTFDIEVVYQNQTVCSGNDVAGPGNGTANASVACGGNNTNGTALCMTFQIGDGACDVECPDDIVVDNDPGECGAFVNIPPLVTSGDCASVTNDFNGTSDPSGFYPAGITEVTITGTDSDGLITECTFTVFVNDTEAPTLVGCEDLTINLDAGECEACLDFDITATDNCPFVGDPMALFTEEAGSPGNFFNGFAGVTFDVANDGPQPITLTGFRVPITTGGASTDIDVYVTNSSPTNVGVQNNAGAWDLLGSVTTPTNVAVAWDVNTFTQVDVGGLVLQPGESRGVYIFLPTSGGAAYRYTNGVFTETDGTLTIESNGFGSAGLFNNSFASRAFVGEVQYTAGGGDAEIIQTDNTGFASGDCFPIGTYALEYQTEDVQGNVGTCTKNITVAEFPNPSPSLACNDQVFVSVDENCEAVINADMILEGGPYGCYTNYIVQLATDMDFNNIIGSSEVGEEGVIVGGAQVGNTYFARVIDPATGNSCWGEVTIEDKLIPALECGTYSAACEASTDPDATISVEPAFLTASEDTAEIEQFQAIACPGGEYSYLRVIDLAAQGITGEFTPQIFRMGVETSTGGVDATLRFYRFTDPSVYDPTAVGFSFADLEQIGDENEAVIPALDLEFWEMPVTDVTVPAGTQYLVWELEVPGGNFADFVMGSNTLGETTPTYLASDFCGTPDPVTLSSQGFDGNWVSMVFGEAGGGIPFPLPEGTTVTPTTGEGPFVVSGFDPCGDVTLSFEDNVTEF